MNGASAPAASPFVNASFILLPVLVFLAVWILYRKALRLRSGPSSSLVALGLFFWLGSAAGLGLSGLLSRFDLRPPPFLALIVAVVLVSLSFGLSRVGGTLSALPPYLLVGIQSFRLPLEIVMHQASVEGVMPGQMSYTGWNFDIVTGATALLLASAMARSVVPRGLIVAWNALGSLLLVNIVTIAFLSTPMLHAFGTGPRELNTFVTFFPFVWLPAALVSTAAAFHIILARALRR